VIWDQSVARQLPYYFGDSAVRLAGLNVPYHRLLIMVVPVPPAVGLRILFVRTRAGIAMRAVVDDPELAALNGAAPARVAQMSWALGGLLAGLSVILITPL